MTDPNSYRTEQIAWIFIAAALLFCLAAMSLIITAENEQTRSAAGIAVIALAASALVFHRMTVEVTAEEVAVRFGFGLIRKRFRLSDIRDSRPVRNRWYYGWGIRMTPVGWIYNVEGLDAVELSFRDGRAVRIGTAEPERLASAIRQAAG